MESASFIIGDVVPINEQHPLELLVRSLMLSSMGGNSNPHKQFSVASEFVF